MQYNDYHFLKYLLTKKTIVYVVYKTHSWMEHIHQQIREIVFDEHANINRCNGCWRITEKDIETTDTDIHFIREEMFLGCHADIVVYEPGVNTQIVKRSLMQIARMVEVSA